MHDDPIKEDELQSLCELAQDAREQAYAPYSNHPVGAVIRSRNGQIFSGCNVENAAHPLGQCAEATAIGSMIRAGEREITDVIVIGPGSKPCTPCGGCRQKLWEFATPETRIHLCVEGKIVNQLLLSDLLPAAFGPRNIPKK